MSSVAWSGRTLTAYAQENYITPEGLIELGALLGVEAALEA